jgi:hypothetical protein
MRKPLQILRSDLTSTPRYYAFRTFRMRNESTVEVMGVKEDVTGAIESIIEGVVERIVESYRWHKRKARQLQFDEEDIRAAAIRWEEPKE